MLGLLVLLQTAAWTQPSAWGMQIMDLGRQEAAQVVRAALPSSVGLEGAGSGLQCGHQVCSMTTAQLHAWL